MAPFYEPGKYRVLVLEQAWDKAKSGAEQLVFKIKVNAKIEDANDGTGETYDAALAHNYERRIFLTFTENSIEYIVKKLRYAGFAGASFEELNLVGAELIAECQHDTRDGKTGEKWDLPWASASVPLKTDTNIARKVNTLFGRALKGGGTAVAGTSPATAQRPLAGVAASGGSGDDDDIPF